MLSVVIFGCSLKSANGTLPVAANISASTRRTSPTCFGIAVVILVAVWRLWRLHWTRQATRLLKKQVPSTCSFVLLLASDILGFWILLTPQANLPSGSSNFSKRCMLQQNWTAQLRGPKWSTCLYTSHCPALALGSRLFISPFQQLIKIKGESKFLEFLIGFQVKDVMEFLLYAIEKITKNSIMSHISSNVSWFEAETNDSVCYRNEVCFLALYYFLLPIEY